MNENEQLQEQIELHGWTDLHIPTQALFDLTGRELKVYAYFIFRARTKGSAFPGIQRMIDDLNTAPEEESWSEPTVKRALSGLGRKKYILRNRRPTRSSITHVFKSPDLYDAFVNHQITGDPTVRSQVIRQSDHGRSDIKSTKEKDNKENIAANAAPKPSSDYAERKDAFVRELCRISKTNYNLTDMKKDAGIVAGQMLKAGYIIADLQAFEKQWYLHDIPGGKSDGKAPSVRAILKNIDKWKETPAALRPEAPPRPQPTDLSHLRRVTPEQSEAARLRVLKEIEDQRKANQ